MTRLLFVLAFVAAVLAQPLWSPGSLVAAPEEQKDQDLIQGTWKVVKLEYEGRVNTDHFREDRYIFKGDQVTLVGGGQEYFKMTFKLDPAKQPKTIDMTITEGVANVGRIDLGIYRLDKDTLTLSRNRGDERPKDFTGAGKPGKPGLLTLERVKSE
jgi:uncharacterized protein (TIGR03067 family)